MVEGEVDERNLAGVPGEWLLPRKVELDSRVVDINPIIRPVLNKEGRQIAQVLEVALEARPGSKQASLGFNFPTNPQGRYNVLTSGWQTWSSSVTTGMFADQLVGMKPYEKSLGGRTIPFIEPGVGNEKISDQEGRSYGWVGFRNTKDGRDIVLGVVPAFDTLENIRYRREGGNITVTVVKDLEGVTSQRGVRFQVFLGAVNPHQEGKFNYADLMVAFSKELSKVAGAVPLMDDRIIGFSWPAYGLGVTQAAVQQEVAAGRGLIDTYVIDDGWETVTGSLTVNRRKFPDLPGLVRHMRKAGIKPGIWVAPFKIKGGTGGLPAEWFVKDKQGRPMRMPFPQPLKYLENSFLFDISNPEFREYSLGRMLDLARMGFEVFKTDFLAAAFTGKLQNTDKTSVEYYRKYFEEFRQRVRDELGKEIEIIGCLAPMMESIGLFNGIRFTPDSAMPNLGSLVNRIPLSYITAIFNTGMYRDAAAVAARRILPFRGVHALILDGVHIADKDVPLDSVKRERLNKSILALNRLGIGNLFIGDSLVRVGREDRQVWQDFINVFKRGNTELVFGKKKLPKIPERFAIPRTE